MNTLICWLLLLLSTAAWHPAGPPRSEGSAALNCDVTVDAGPDQTICNPGQPVSLDAFASGNFLSAQWFPSTGLSNPNSLSPVATVNTTATYTVTVNAASNQNLMSNWDFSQGFNGFSSNYIPGNGGAFGLLSNEGTYAVSSNPALAHINFSSFGDISGDGNMLVVNGAGVANQTILCQTVSVTPNTDYAFSTFVASAISESPARLQFSVNGQLIGSIFNASATPGQWNEFYAAWNSGASTGANICVVNQNTALSGNDFCLDGLFFSELCEAIDDVTITVVQAGADFNPPSGLCANSPPVNLDNYLSPGATSGGVWTVNGAATSIFDPGQWGAGVHNISYSVSQPPCTETASEFIVVDPLPQALWSAPFDICEAEPPLDMDDWLFPNSLPGGSWTIDGLPGNGQFNPGAWGPGQHLVSYTAGTPPCNDSYAEFVEVSAPPSARFTAPPEICEQAAPILLSSWLDPGAEAGGRWTINGIPTSVLDPADLGPGVYDIIYEAGVFPCQDIGQATVVISAGDAPMPACLQVANNSITVAWPPVSGAASYTVQAQSGQLGGSVSGTTFTLAGLAPGETVGLIVTPQGGSGCLSPSEIVSCTTLECIPPVVVIEEEPPNCEDVPAFNLSAMVADSFPAGVWSGPGITDAANGTFDPAMAGAGIHTVQFVTNPGGCPGQGVISIEVLPVPVAEFTLPDTICISDTAVIEFTGVADTSTIFFWNIDGGRSLNADNDTLQKVYWAGPGQKVIILWLEQEGCMSEVFTDTLDVQPLIQPPLVNCRSTETSVEFFWPADPLVDSFLVSILGPQLGIMPTDTSFLVEGLTPGDSVNISLTALSANACPDTTVLATCIAEACPEIALAVTPVPAVCLDEDTEDISLGAMLSGGPADGEYSWQGPGVTDAQAGIFSPAIAGPGAHTINLLYTVGSCSFNASATITVRPVPVADFSAASPICQTESSEVIFTGSAGNNATFAWNLAGGNGSPADQFDIQWAAPGLYNIQLRIEEEGCLSETVTRTVQVDDTLAAPLISCEGTYTSVLFSWNGIPNASSFQVEVLDGPAGAMPTGNSYLIGGLQPGQAASIRLTALSDNACPAVSTTAACAALPCPAVSLSVLSPPDQCFDGTPFGIPLLINIQNDTGNGSLSWSGTGITDPANAQWTVEAGQVGQPNPIIATWTEDVCTVSDTAFLDVFATPAAGFTAAPVICVEGQATVSYTGTATPGATYDWDFGNAQLISGAGGGPYQLQWPAAGSYALSLQVEENGCTSGISTQNVQVEPVLEPPLINCEPGFGTILFTWSPVANASAYQVNGPGSIQGDTAYRVDGLLPGQEASITVTAQSANACPAVSASAACAALLCPEATVSMALTPFLCAGGEAVLDITFSGNGGPYGMTLLIDGQPTALSGVEEHYTMALPLTESSLFTLENIIDAGHPNCGLPAPPPVTAVVRQPVTAGTPTGPIELCSRTDTALQLFNLLEGEQAGGAWALSEGPALLPDSFGPAGGSFLPAQQPPGSYLFTYHIQAEAPCPNDSAAVRVTINERPVADAGQDITLSCTFNVGSLGGPGTSQGPGLQYNWSSDDDVDIMNPGQAFIDASQPGTYRLRVLNTDNGCSDEDTALVDSEIAFLVPHATVSPISCFQANDGLIAIDSIGGGTAPYRYSLNGGPFSSSPAFVPLGPGAYDILVEDATGCRAELQFRLEEPDELQVVLLANFQSEDNSIRIGDSLQLQALVNIPEEEVDKVYWQPDSLGCDSCLTAVFAPQLSTAFSVRVTDANGCTARDIAQVIVQKDYNVFIPNAFSPNGDGYNDLFMIFAGKEVKEVKVFKVFNRWGETVLEQGGFLPNDPRFGWDGVFRGQPMNAAVFAYFAEIEMVDGQVVVFKGDVALVR